MYVPKTPCISEFLILYKTIVLIDMDKSDILQYQGATAFK